jgi:hypothetical protein
MAVDTSIPEPRHDRHVEHRRRTGLYLCAFALVAPVVVLGWVAGIVTGIAFRRRTRRLA